jgi:hypothetical protein
MAGSSPAMTTKKTVMRGLDPRILLLKRVDRIKSGHDDKQTGMRGLDPRWPDQVRP